MTIREGQFIIIFRGPSFSVGAGAWNSQTSQSQPKIQYTHNVPCFYAQPRHKHGNKHGDIRKWNELIKFLEFYLAYVLILLILHHIYTICFFTGSCQIASWPRKHISMSSMPVNASRLFQLLQGFPGMLWMDECMNGEKMASKCLRGFHCKVMGRSRSSFSCSVVDVLNISDHPTCSCWDKLVAHVSITSRGQTLFIGSQHNYLVWDSFHKMRYL